MQRTTIVAASRLSQFFSTLPEVQHRRIPVRKPLTSAKDYRIYFKKKKTTVVRAGGRYIVGRSNGDGDCDKGGE